MLEKLKARAYDLMAMIQHTQKQLNEVNQQIAKEMQKVAKEKPEDEK